MMKKKPMLSLHVTTGSYDDFNDAIINVAKKSISHYVCVANAHMIVEARKSINFASIVNQALIVTPDGKPVTWAFNLLYGMKQDRVAGMDLLPDLLNAAADNNVPVFFYGGSPVLLSETERYLFNNIPSLKIAGMHSPPFHDLTAREEDDVAEKINRSGAKLVFVVLGCPKQEKWMARMKGKINAVMIGIGGALPVLIGIQKRAPLWMQDKGLEWLYRLQQEPRRLFRRYAVTNAVFCYMLLKAWARQGFSRKAPLVEYKTDPLSA
jgi:N-acetylglucosaminyldiphosphoundecaprenol N-acetyl-beta-D-mannosaminyltransferase